MTELDAAQRFQPGKHLDGRNAAELIYFSTMAHVERLREKYEIVAVCGNSLGWYTALPAAGCLDLLQGRRLIETMARLQAGMPGGQLLTTTLTDDWTVDPELADAVEETLEEVSRDHFVARSIRLGAHEVLAGTEAGITALLERLPKVEREGRAFPFRLAGHGPFHTRLCADVSQRAVGELFDLPVSAPDVHLIDGRGDISTPWSACPEALLDYTTTGQVLETFDFTASVRTAIREFQPEYLVCAGPGVSLRAPVGHVVLAEGYRGIGSKSELFASSLVAVD